MVQWLRLPAPTAGGTDSIPGGGTKIPHATRCWGKKKAKECDFTAQSFKTGLASPWQDFVLPGLFLLNVLPATKHLSHLLKLSWSGDTGSFLLCVAWCTSLGREVQGK